MKAGILRALSFPKVPPKRERENTAAADYWDPQSSGKTRVKGPKIKTLPRILVTETSSPPRDLQERLLASKLWKIICGMCAWGGDCADFGTSS